MLTLNRILKIMKYESSYFNHLYDYDAGWVAYVKGEPYQDDANVSWQTGWLDAQDADVNNHSVIQPNS